MKRVNFEFRSLIARISKEVNSSFLFTLATWRFQKKRLQTNLHDQCKDVVMLIYRENLL